MRLCHGKLGLTVVAMLLASGCQSANFSANGKKSTPTAAAPATTPIPSGTPAVTKPENCNENGGTIATFLTKNLQNGASSQTVDIALSLADCNGTPRSLAGQTLYFDTECAVADATKFNLPYTIKGADDGVTMASGVLDYADGDLWGKNRSNFYYFQTQAVSLNAPASRIILSVQFGGHSLDCANVNGSTANSENAPFLFRIGASAPTTQTIEVRH